MSECERERSLVHCQCQLVGMDDASIEREKERESLWMMKLALCVCDGKGTQACSWDCGLSLDERRGFK